MHKNNSDQVDILNMQIMGYKRNWTDSKWRMVSSTQYASIELVLFSWSESRNSWEK